MRKTFYYLILIFTILSCSKNNPETHFLDFSLGMSKEKFLKTKDSLIKDKRITRGYSSEECSFEFDIEEKKIRTNVKFNFKLKELNKIEINIGDYRKPSNYQNSEGFFMYYSARNVDVYKIYELYETKYGKPTRILGLEKPNQIREWNFKDYLIRFNVGIYESYEQKNASISYSFNREYKEKRKEELIKKEKNKNMNDI